MTWSAFIIGGTGQIGIAAAARLLNDGWRVTLNHTGKRPPQNIPAGAELVAFDRRDTEALKSALGTGVDAIVDAMAFNGQDADQLAGLRSLYGRLAVISSASVYQDPEGRSLETAGTLGLPTFAAPCLETDDTVAPGPESYSSGKVELERRLLDAGLPLAILRPCAIHGVNSKHPREFWFVKRMLDRRKRIPLAGNTDARFHTSATANIAALLATALDQPGQLILNAGDPNPPSVREIGELLAARLGWTGEFVAAPDNSPIGGTPFSVPSDFTVSMEAATALGYQPAGSYTETLRPYLAWMAAHAASWRDTFPMFTRYPSDPFDYAAEDAAL